MTRKEITNHRDLSFSTWVRTNLPDSSTGFLVSDLDFILQNYNTKKIMLIEIKTHGCPLKTWQSKLFNQIDKWLKNGVDNDWQYYGFHVITFENTFFNDGKTYLDGVEKTENEIKKFLSFDFV